jgi:hypothetical protein
MLVAENWRLTAWLSGKPGKLSSPLVFHMSYMSRSVNLLSTR